MSNLTLIPFKLPGKIYRSPMPMAAFDIGGTTLEEYHQAGIDTVVMLIAEGEDQQLAGQDLKELYQEQGWQVLHIPVIDFDVPVDRQVFKKTLQAAQSMAENGKNLVVHCFAGRGRTGLFLAILARRISDLEGLEAIDWLRQFFPAVETEEQAQMVIDF